MQFKNGLPGAEFLPWKQVELFPLTPLMKERVAALVSLDRQKTRLHFQQGGLSGELGVEAHRQLVFRIGRGRSTKEKLAAAQLESGALPGGSMSGGEVHSWADWVGWGEFPFVTLENGLNPDLGLTFL